MSGSTNIKQAVERQSGACRALAISLEQFASESRIILHAERKILSGYADQFLLVSEELTKAIQEDQSSRLQTLWMWAKVSAGAVAVAVAAGAAEGGTGQLFEDEQVARCVMEVLAVASEDYELVVRSPKADKNSELMDALARGDLQEAFRMATDGLPPAEPLLDDPTRLQQLLRELEES